MAEIVIRGVGKTFVPERAGPNAGPVLALQDVDLAIGREEIVCVLGPSGCGKSTLLSLIAGFERPSSGEVLAGGRAVVGSGPDRMVVFQAPTLFPWLTVLENIVLGPRKRGVARAVYGPRGQELIAAAGLGGFEHYYPYQLSGGMQQRVQIARALINEPQVLLMDEPFGALDSQTRLLMQEQLQRVWDQFHPTILFITHDVEEALFLADRVAVMTARPGRIKEEIVVPFDKPRDIAVLTAPEFVSLKERLLRSIRQEVVAVW